MAVFSLALLASTGPASAYFVDSGTFADGTGSWQGSALAGAEVQGPSVRLLTNSTVVQGTIVIEGTTTSSTVSAVETSTADFASNMSSSGIRASAGSLSLESTSGVVLLNESNGFLSSTMSGIAVRGGNLGLDNSTTGSLLTQNLTAPAAGWGILSMVGTVPPGASFSVDVLSPAGLVLVDSHPIGSPLPLDALVNPTIRLVLALDAPAPAPSPQIRQVTLGQQVSDSFVGSGITRTLANMVEGPTGTPIMTANELNLQRAPGNPLIVPAASTFYSAFVHTPSVIRAGSEWRLYFIGGSTLSATIGHIGLAVSSDLTNWTVRASPLLSPTPGTWTASGLGEPYVMQDPDSSGYLLYFEGWNSTSRGIGLATSSDGLNWTEYSGNPVLAPTAASWDSGLVGEVAYVQVVNGTWTLWYSGRTATGYRSIGIATSTDGSNWTKYAGNPVLAPSAGADSQEVASGNIAIVRGLYEIYYSCSSGSGYGVCFATSADGYSWTKSGSVLSTTGGWEGSDVAGPSIVQVNGSISVFYVGFSAGVIKIGRADAAWRTGFLSATVDLGVGSPAALGSLTRNVSLPAGALADVQLSSSPDLLSWSALENMSAKTAVQTTPANRYVRWTVALRAATRGTPAELRSMTLSYLDLFRIGFYNSSVFSYSLDVSAVTPTITLTAGSDPVDVRLSNDGGATWSSASSGSTVLFATPGRQVAYGLSFEPVAGRSPAVDAVSLLVELQTRPSNLTLRFAGAASPFWSLPGSAVGAQNITLPVDALNAAIAAAAALTPAPPTVELATYVGSSAAGGVELRELRLRYQLKNPLSTQFSPQNASVLMNEGASAMFSVGASSYPPQIPVNLSWYLDGAEVVASRGQAAFSYAADFEAAGNHSVRCLAENGDFSKSMQWNLTVVNLNRPPIITAASPVAASLTQSRGVIPQFSVDATDADGGTLIYFWTVDANAVPAASGPALIVARFAVGTHTVSVSVSDGEALVAHNWSVIVVNGAPVISSASPAPGSLNFSHASRTPFLVEGSDPDGDSLTFSWQLDGTTVAGASAPNFTNSPLTVGAHVLVATVSDGLANDSRTWTLTVVNAPPVLQSKEPDGPAGVDTAAPQTFRVTAADGDADTVTFAWYFDDRLQPGGGSAYTTPAGLPPGPHKVSVVASDGLGQDTSAQWLFITPAAPVASTTGDAGLLILVVVALVAVAVVAWLVVRKRRSRDTRDENPREPVP